MARTPRKVSVLVLSWNGKRHLEPCLDALEAQRPPGAEVEILLLDNGSTDGTADWVRHAHPRVRLVESEANLGFCAGNNRLAELAEGDLLALVNNDTRAEPDWLAALVDAYRAAPDDVAAVGGRIVDWEAERLDFGRGILTFDGHAFQLDFRRPLASARAPRAGEELLFGCGGNLLIERDAFVAVGGFDPSYFAYLEDVDLGWRLWSSGRRVVASPEGTVRHRSSATSDLLGRHHRGFLFERNALRTVAKNLEPELWQRLMPAVLLTFLARVEAMLVESNPGGALLRSDPFAGAIADTGAPPPRETIAAKWRRMPPGEFFRRAVGKAWRALGAGRGGGERIRVEDPRTIAQLRAISFFRASLRSAGAERDAIARRRRRSDREILERFPLWIVPTYPGDETLFADPGFDAWLPSDLHFERARLEEVMLWPG
ncbi:MAG: glycosyltransferase family 2 protein [Acidobacteria bacterium]|nr:glycosyltransferase family 2 protein [Acidobacteriota bacterium]MCB9377504.1 glycosyltransferase family 2 protein [Holophagales bacterium]